MFPLICLSSAALHKIDTVSIVSNSFKTGQFFISQFGIGLAVGIGGGWLSAKLLRWLDLAPGLYAMLALALGCGGKDSSEDYCDDTDFFDAERVLQVDITDASFLGFPVVGMSHWVGHRNGINGFSFTLDAPLAKVQAKVDSSLEIVDSCSIDTECSLGPFEMTVNEASGNKTEITCDTSM